MIWRTARSRQIFPPLVLFALNLWISWRLFHTEYLDQMQSIEGAFIALATYIERHWPGYDWFPLWYSGMPFTRTYQPGLHYFVAAAAKLFDASPALTYHATVSLTYSLGAVALYSLIRVFGGDRPMAFLGGLSFSLFSPSSLLIPAIRRDAGGFLNARRMEELVFYGEGPNITGLTLAMIALALLHLALQKRKPYLYLAASLALAAVPAVNWTATMALLMALIAYAIAGTWPEIRSRVPRMIMIGAATALFAFPFALPSTIRGTFFDTVDLDDVPTAGPARWICFGLMFLSLAVLRALLIRWRAAYGVRFAALFFVISGWIVLAVYLGGIHLTPNPKRFHLAWEIPLAVAIAFPFWAMYTKAPRARVPLTIGLTMVCLAQGYHYSRYARGIIRPTDITKRVEYQEAEWLRDHEIRGPVFLQGSNWFWSHVFTETPLMNGCCIPSLSNAEPLAAGYLILNGYRDDAQSADFALLWLKAYGAQAIGIGGPHSREYYKEYKFPYRFAGRLPLLWRDGDDFIYGVPERAPGLARVVRESDPIRHPPVNGIDDAELRPFVRALEDPSLPVADFAWVDVNTARVSGALMPGQVLSIAETWNRGWTATANGRPVPVRADGLGLITLDPRCAGPCEVRLRWSPGSEPGIAIGMASMMLIGMLAWSFYSGK